MGNGKTGKKYSHRQTFIEGMTGGWVTVIVLLVMVSVLDTKSTPENSR